MKQVHRCCPSSPSTCGSEALKSVREEAQKWLKGMNVAEDDDRALDLTESFKNVNAPDIACAVSRICSTTSKGTDLVQASQQLLWHLNATQGLGLWYPFWSP